MPLTYFKLRRLKLFSPFPLLTKTFSQNSLKSFLELKLSKSFILSGDSITAIIVIATKTFIKKKHESFKRDSRLQHFSVLNPLTQSLGTFLISLIKFQYDHTRKHYLNEIENRGQDQCKEHARVLHQIEHITWHLEGCTRHRPCMGRMPETCPNKKSTPSNASCVSSSAPTCNRPSATVRRPLITQSLIHSFDHSSQIHFSQTMSWNCDNERIFLARQT